MLWILAVVGIAQAFVTYEPLVGNEVTDPAICKNHYYPFDGNSCKYYQCEETDIYSSGWQSFERTCMKPLNFDPETCSCQWPTMIKGVPDWTCHDGLPTGAAVQCDVIGETDKCCQPCESYWPIPDCTRGWGLPYTRVNDTHYSYCEEVHECPKDTIFDLDTCRCSDAELWPTFSYMFPFYPGEDSTMDETKGSIINPGECMVNPGGQSGLACSGTGEPAKLEMMTKQWLGRAWAIGFAVDNAAEGILISNGNDDVDPTVEFSRDGGEIVATFTGDQGSVELRVPYIEGNGLQRYLAHMQTDGFIYFRNNDLDGDKVSPTFTWVLEGTKCPLNIGQSMGLYTDILVSYFAPSNQAAVDWVFGGDTPLPYDQK